MGEEWNEMLYYATSPYWQHVKIGCWNGHYADLWSRYAVVLGPDVTEVVIFNCDGRRALEAIAHGYLRKYHISGEVYETAAIPDLLHFCKVMCHDHVTRDTDNRAKDLRKVCKAARKKREEEEHEAQRMQLEQTDREVMDRFIKEHCKVAPSFSVSSSAFKKALSAQGINKSAPDIKRVMEAKGFKFKRGIQREFLGLQLISYVETQAPED